MKYFIAMLGMLVAVNVSAFDDVYVEDQINAYLDALGETAQWSIHYRGSDIVVGKWVSNAPKPTAADMSPPSVISLPRKYRKVVGNKWVEKTPAEKTVADADEQATKANRLKNAEKKLVAYLRAENASMPADAKFVLPAHYEAFFEYLETLPDGQADSKYQKFDRLLRTITRFGGDENDVYDHP